MINKGRIVVAYAHAGNMKVGTAESLLKLQKFDIYNEHIIHGFVSAGGHFTTVNRNAVVEQFMKNQDKPEWLLFIDTDIVFPDPSIIYGLYQDADPQLRPIVSGLYFTYIDTGFTAAWLVRKSSTVGEYQSLPEIQPALQEVDGIGMGCAIIHRSVLEKIAEAYPRDKDPWVWFGHDLVMTSKGPDRLGEDLTFCRRARELGFTIWGDGRLGFTHLKEREESAVTVTERYNAGRWMQQEQEAVRVEHQKAIDAFWDYATGPSAESKEMGRLVNAWLDMTPTVPTESNGAIIP